jgi:hypothetical protein
MAYLLDSDVFIQAKNLHYGFDFCPGFWDWIDVANAAGTVISIENVRIERLGGNGDLASWASGRGGSLFVGLDAAMAPSLRATSVWATTSGYDPAAVSLFLQVADYYLVACAHALGHIVVSHERPSTSTKKSKIPDACLGMGVRFMSPFEMLRAEGARFVLAPYAHRSALPPSASSLSSTPGPPRPLPAA